MSTLGWEAVAAGIRDEDRVAAALGMRGWGVTPFGQRMWDPTTCVHGDGTLITAVRRTRGSMRHAPDLLAGHPERGVCLVEVVDGKGRGQRCMEVAKLRSFDDWAHICAVVIVDAHGSDWSAWVHHAQWPYDCESDITRRTFNGSGDPYAWFSRRADRSFDSMFGTP